jgi:predicted dehydrogenase
MKDDKLGFAVIGCGRMGKRRMRAIMEHSNAELVCVVDVNEQDAKSAANEFNCSYYINYCDAISRTDVACVVVSVPNKWHKEIVIAALDAGKHVFCEKPLARTPNEALEMVEAARRAGRTLKVGSNLRYFPNVMKAKELLDQGDIGEPLFLRCWIGHDGWNIQSTGSWFRSPEVAGGGTFLDNGCHVLDIARWFMGEVKSCIGFVKTSLWQIQPLEDNGFGIFETVDGKVIYVQSSWTEWNGYMYMEIYGSEGYIRVDSRGKNCITALGDRKGNEQVFDFSDLPPTSYKAEFEDYMRALMEGRYPSPSGYDGLRAVQMVWGIYNSSQTGRKVEI